MDEAGCSGQVTGGEWTEQKLDYCPYRVARVARIARVDMSARVARVSRVA